MTIGDVCKKCNTGWMSGLEEAAAPLLTPLIEGRRQQYGNDELLVLRSWATKTAIGFACFSREAFRQSIPPGLAHGLLTAHTSAAEFPPVLAWAASYAPLGEFAYRYMSAQGVGQDPRTGQVHQVIRVVFIAGHAAFCVRLADDHAALRHLGWQPPLPEFTPLRPLKRDRRILVLAGSIDDAGVSETFNRSLFVSRGNVWPRRSWPAPTGLWSRRVRE
jgi:hypothetical protein